MRRGGRLQREEKRNGERKIEREKKENDKARR